LTVIILVFLYFFLQLPRCYRVALISRVRPHVFGFNPRNSFCVSASLQEWTNKIAPGTAQLACTHLHRKPLLCFGIHASIRILTPISAAFLASAFD
jgi:hypothetical protein